MGCPKIIDVDFYDIEQERIDHNLRVMINTRSEQRRRMAEREAMEAERIARMEARAEQERKAKRNYNALHGFTSALFVCGMAWAGYAGLVAPVIALPAVCIGFAIFGGRVANAVRYSSKGRESR